MQKAGIPRHRCRDGPAVCQLHKDGILSAGNSHDTLTRIRHELPPTPQQIIDVILDQSLDVALLWG